MKHHGPVSLDTFACADVNENSDVSRIYYDKAERYMIICLKSTYHPYFSADAGTVQALQSDSSSSRASMARAATGPSIAGPIPPHPEQVHALDPERLCQCPDLPPEQLGQAHIVKADDVVAKLALDEGLGGLRLFSSVKRAALNSLT